MIPIHSGTCAFPFNVLGYRFVVVTEPRTAAVLQRLYGPSTGDTPDEATPVFALDAADRAAAPGWCLQLPDAPAAAHATLAKALRHLDYEVCRRVMEHRTELLWLHGALLATARGSILISGSSAAGKTTLTLGLLALGYPVGGDDVITVEPTPVSVRAFPWFLHPDAHAQRLLRRANRWPSFAQSPSAALLPTCPLVDLGPPHAVLIKEPPTAEPPRVTPITQAEAVVLLLERSRAERLAHSLVLSTLHRLTAGAACYRVSGGHLPDLIDAVADVIGPPPTHSARSS